MDDDGLDSDEPMLEQSAVIERELHRVFGNHLGNGVGPMLLPLTSHGEFIALLINLPDNATDTQLRAGLERVRAARPKVSPELE